MQTKKCSKCDKVKPLSEFSRDRNTKDGLCYKCKTCARDYNRDFHKRKRREEKIRKEKT